MKKESKNQPAGLLSAIEKRASKHLFRWLLAYPVAAAGLALGVAGVVGGSLLLGIIIGLAIAYYCLCLVFSLLLVVKWRREADRLNSSIAVIEEARNRFASRIGDYQVDNREYFEFSNFQERISIKADGNTTITRRITIVAGAQGVDVFFTSIESLAGSPDDVDAVTASVRRVTDDGTRVSIPNYACWITDRKFRSYVFPVRQLAPGAELTLEVVFCWPRFYQELISGRVDSTLFGLNRHCAALSCFIELERGEGLFEHHPPHVEIVNRTSATSHLQVTSTDTRHQVEFTTTNVKWDEVVGFDMSAVMD